MRLRHGARAVGAAAIGLVGVLVGAPTAGAVVPAAATPIDHVVVIFQENVSFDHYFGTYPYAANTDGQHWTNPADTGSPPVDGLYTSTTGGVPSGPLLTANPNQANPRRLDSSPVGLGGDAGGQLTCDMDHNYSDEQQAFDSGKMDQFVQSVSNKGSSTDNGLVPCNVNQVMDFYDGNTVTGLWTYAQRYAMSDQSYNTTFGPSSPGAINLVSGDTGDVDTTHMVHSPSIATSAKPNADLTADGLGGYSLTSDAQPYWDDCSTRDAVALNGTNVGDQLNAAGLSWGWFQGGERPSTDFNTANTTVNGSNPPGTATFIPDEFSGKFPVTHASNQGICNTVTPIGVALGGTGQYGYKDDYIPHHEPFDYYASTANPHHLTIAADKAGHDKVAGPDSLSTVGRDTQSYAGSAPQFDTPNHQYDTSDFDQLVAHISSGDLPASALPAVSFLKAPGFEDGHAGYSDPADEQQFVVREINALMKTPDWAHTAVFVNYDDSDGWYDHVQAAGEPVNPSASPADNLTNTTLGTISATNPTSGLCGDESGGNTPLAGEQGRCGLGPRIPMLAISPWAKHGVVDHAISDNSSITRFIEGNWGLGSINGSFASLPYNGMAPTNTAFAAEGPLADLFSFTSTPQSAQVLLDPATGRPLTGGRSAPGSEAAVGGLALGGGVWALRRRRALRRT